MSGSLRASARLGPGLAGGLMHGPTYAGMSTHHKTCRVRSVGWIDPKTIGQSAAVALAATAVVQRTDRRPPYTASGSPPDAKRARLVESLLSRDECEVLEFKSWPGLHQDGPLEQGKMERKTAKELCGFANAKGGDLLIGVDDDGWPEGFVRGGGLLSRKGRDKKLAWMTNVIVDYLGVEYDGLFCREIVVVDGRDVLHCAVAASKNKPVVLKKRLEGKHNFFVRAGNTCIPLGSQERIEYIKTKWPKWIPSQQHVSHPAPDQGSSMEDVVRRLVAEYFAVEWMRRPGARGVGADRRTGRRIRTGGGMSRTRGRTATRTRTRSRTGPRKPRAGATRSGSSKPAARKPRAGATRSGSSKPAARKPRAGATRAAPRKVPSQGRSG